MSNAADQAIAFARAQIGKPYQWGATGPNSYDCSGLIYAAYRSAGVNLGRTTYQQIFNGHEITKADLAPGDLVFPDPGHVQIYTGGGRIIESPTTGETVVERAMWGFWRARRVTDPGTGTELASLNTTPASNPLSDAYGMIKSIFDVFTNVDKTVTWLSDSHNLIRIGMGIGGAVLIMAALSKMAGTSTGVADFVAQTAGAVKKGAAAK